MAPLLLNGKQLADALGVSVRTVRAWDAGGKLPAPIRFGGGCVRWSVRDVQRWIDAGCPDRRTWEAIKRGEPDRMKVKVMN